MKFRICISLFIVLILAGPAAAGGLSSARAVAMGDAQIALARGVHAPLYNPANLGLSGYSENGMELVGVGIEAYNNSFSVDDYETYNGAVLSETDKEEFLARIPDEGLKFSANAEASLFSVSSGSFVLSINGVAASELDLGRDVIELLMEGNNLGDTVSLDGTYGSAVSYASLGFSYARSIYKAGTRQLSIGATYRYIRGIAYAEVVRAEGSAATEMTGFSGEGIIISRTALGGSGHALDLGAALRLSDDYTVGIAFSNFLSTITWNNETKEQHLEYRFDTLTVDNMEDDSVVISDDYTREIGNFKSSLPTIMRIGIANWSGKFRWAIDREQGFKVAPGASTRPRLMGGLEYRLTRFLPLRTGYSMGGGKGSNFAVGAGLDFSLIYLDLALNNHGGLTGGSSKGIHYAASFGIRF